MIRPRYDTGMPLFIWFMAFVIALVLLVALYLFEDTRGKRLRNMESQNPPVEEYSNSDGSELDACFLGSSMTNCALIRYHSLDSIIDARKVRFNYKSFVGSRFSLEDLDNKIEEIRTLRPKYLFIESGIACYDFRADGFSRFRIWLSNVPLYFVLMVNQAFGLLDKPQPRSYFGQSEAKLDFDNLYTDIDNLANSNFKIRKMNEFPVWDLFFMQAPALGIRIFLLEMPRSGDAEKFIPARLNREYNSLVKQYYNQYGITYIDFPDHLDRNTYYMDRAHFNEPGSDYYCSWLLKEFCTRNLLKCD